MLFNQISPTVSALKKIDTSIKINAQIIPTHGINLPLPALMLTLMLALFFPPAFAETLQPDDPIIVTASRFETSIATAPVNVTVIPAEQIQKSPARNLAQALENLGGVYVKDLFGVAGSKSSIDMGGFGATGTSNTLILLNGRRLNDADLAGVNLDAIPLESVERIEIVRGNASVLYGDNATSGVINIVTKSGFDQTQSSVKAHSGTDRTKGFTVNVATSEGSNALMIAGNTVTSDGYRDNSAYENKSALLDYSHTSDDALYGVRLNASDDALELPGSLNEPQYLEDPRSSSSLSIEFANENRVTTELYFQNRNFAAELAFRNRNQNSLLFGNIHSDLKTFSFTPRYTASFGANTLVSGIDLYKSSLDIDSNFASSGYHNTNETKRESLAFYMTDKIRLNSTTEVNIGLRRQKVALDVTSNTITPTPSNTATDDKDDTLTSWDISFNHHFTPDAGAYVRLAKGMRFPVLDEIWGFFFGTINLLEPQQSRHFEIGAHVNVNLQHRLSVNVFGIKLEDEIIYNPITFANQNLDPSRHEGIDIIYQGKLDPSWTLNVAFNYRRATFREGIFAGNDIPEIPRKRLTLTQQFDLGQQRSVGIDTVYTGERRFGGDFNNEGKNMPGHALMHMNYQQENHGWLFSLKINNLTNQKTADFGIYGAFADNPYFYYALPERAYLVSIGKKW